MIIGLGNCGCKITKLFADMGYSTMFANGSEQDLKVLGNMKGIYKLDGYDGFGGHRERAMECLCDNVEFTEALEKIETENYNPYLCCWWFYRIWIICSCRTVH